MEFTYEDMPFVTQGSGVPRSTDRLHLTDVIRAIGVKLKLIPDYGDGDKTPGKPSGSGWLDMGLTAELGFLWEEVLAMPMIARLDGVWRPGEVELDDIVGSPDGIGPDPAGVHPIVLHEAKFTWKSARSLPTANWYYLTQVQAYCRMCGLTAAVWHICYVMGRYDGKGPLYRQCRVQFTEQELWQTWEMIRTYAKRIRK